MTGHHITRDYSAHKKSVIRPYDEYAKLEIDAFNPLMTQTYSADDNSLKTGENCYKTSWKSWTCYKSEDKLNDMIFSIKYNAKENGSYRVDLLYEQKSNMNNSKEYKKYNTGKNLIGHCTISKSSKKYYDKDIKFDGRNNITKRKTIFVDLDKGKHTIDIEIPHNCFFYGVIVRRVITFIGDNYYGDNLGSEEGSLTVTKATITDSDMIKATELSVEIFYDDRLECYDSPSGFYIDYANEVNFYIKDDDGKIRRVFGGYVSSVLPDADRTKLTIACADRLVDGENKYVLDELQINGGDDEEKQYTTVDVKSYAQGLKYLCDIYELTLNSNISKDYAVDGEKYIEGLSISYGLKKKVKKVKTNNAKSKMYNNHVLLRNKSSSEKQQVWTLYNAKDYAKKPPSITDTGYMHITYGMGDVETTTKSKIEETVDVSDTSAGSQKFGKCGRSSDDKYVMAIGKPSAGNSDARKHNVSVNQLYKTIFENKCPHCGGKLVWDSGRSDTDCVHCGGYRKSKREWGNISETEITCTKCCADYCAVTGTEKDNAHSTRLKTVSKPVKSSKSEQDKLHNGKMVAMAKGGVEVTPDSIFKSITKLAFKYKYKRGATGQTYSQMQKSGHGDCWGFSDLISHELKRYKVNHKIAKYKTNASSEHRSVLYQNDKKQWVDFPYKEYGWDTKYNNMLNPTSKSKTAHAEVWKKGTTIGNAKSPSSSSQSQTTELTTTKGYNTQKPIQGYLKIVYSLKQSFTAKKYSVRIKLTQDTYEPVDLNNAFKFYWVNNTIKEATFNHKIGNTSYSLTDYLKKVKHGENASIYLQSIQLIAPPVKPSDDNKDTDWYKYDKSTHDNSSCKMQLYQIRFDNNSGGNSDGLKSCGKTANALMKEFIDSTGYYVYLEYGRHRMDDKIHFYVNNQSQEQYTASEGDNNNILSWNSISYSPVGSLFNMSMVVFLKQGKEYKFVDTRDPRSILEYGEKCTLKTDNTITTSKEAYFDAVMSNKFEPRQTYSFTITVPNMPNLHIGDLVKVVANAKKLNSIKEVKSIKITFDYSKMPRIQTELGLGELAPDIQLQKNIRQLRTDSKKESTAFGSPATPVEDELYYEWDR